jgi:hypothetical protein
MPEVRTTSSTGGQKGVKLERFDLIPAGPMAELARHYGRGARKYANHQWRQGYEWSKSIAALGRHFNYFIAGKDYDVCSNDPTGCQHVDAEGEPFESGEPDTCFNHTGSHHMAAVAWHSFLLLEFKDTQPGHDDRFKPTPVAEEIDEETREAIRRGYEQGRAFQKRIDYATMGLEPEEPVEGVEGWIPGERAADLDPGLAKSWIRDYDAENPSLDLGAIIDRYSRFFNPPSVPIRFAARILPTEITDLGPDLLRKHKPQA